MALSHTIVVNYCHGHLSIDLNDKCSNLPINTVVICLVVPFLNVKISEIREILMPSSEIVMEERSQAPS